MRPIRRAPWTLAAAAALLPLAAPAAGQSPKPALDHDDYDRWNRIDGERLSDDGRWLAFAVVPGEGDGYLQIRGTSREAGMTLARATDPAFSGDSRWVVATLPPPWALVDSLRRAGTERDDLPGDSLVVVSLERAFAGPASDPEAAVERFGEVRSFRLAPEGPWLAVHEPAPDDEEEEAREGAEPEEEEEADEEAESRDRGRPGTPLLLRNLDSGAEQRFDHVTAFHFTDDGRALWFTRTTPDGAGDGVVRVDLASGAAAEVASGPGRYTGLSLQEDGHRAVFLTDRDTPDEDAGTMAVYVADAAGTARRVAAAGDPGVPVAWGISTHRDPTLSVSGERVFFGVRPPSLPIDPALEDLLDDEKVRLDVWSWHDDRLQPMQLVELEDDTTHTYLAVVPFDGGPVVALADPELPDVRTTADGDAPVALGVSDLPYRKLVSWDARYSDAWVVDMSTGERRLVAEKVRGSARLSPGARWVYWWDGDRRAWMARSVEGGETVDLTAALPHPVHDELDDHPDAPPPHGEAGWTDGDATFLVYDRHDVWAVDPTRPEAPRAVTEGVGRRAGMRFRVVDTDPDRETLAPDAPLLLSAFHLTTKESGFYRDRIAGTTEPARLRLEDARLSTPRKAAEADRWLFTRETFETFPDLWVSGPDFDDAVRLSDANPQQDEVRWGTAELVEWTSNDGVPLQGILYKPEGFDPSRAYPMMVYFYERSSDGLHRHVVPSAGGSSINYSFYVSRGYLVFVPDIPYEIGHPGESALDAVVPGVQYLANQGFVDRDRIGVQGHSWGGYQIAWMITRTNLFAAAEAGAPVANMTSAYGGIRWGSGMSRMFQYERTQSRIGGTLWESPLLYIRNSPLFALDKVGTPLLMMHNDEDTAVPWEQGIELFVALRRLDKPVWLLNYNGEPHGLTREANRKDWAIRMQQFFDHYLMDAPAPVWMEEGLPAVLKGKSLGLETAGSRPVSDSGGN